MILLRLSGTSPEEVELASRHWAVQLGDVSARLTAASSDPSRTRQQASQAVQILGPVPSPRAKLRGRYRYQLLVRSHDHELARRIVSGSLEKIEGLATSRLKYEIDVDPTEMG